MFHVLPSFSEEDVLGSFSRAISSGVTFRPVQVHSKPEWFHTNPFFRQTNKTPLIHKFPKSFFIKLVGVWEWWRFYIF
jgi:hypothetical protein